MKPAIRASAILLAVLSIVAGAYWAFQHGPLASERTLLKNAAKSGSPSDKRAFALYLANPEYQESPDDLNLAHTLLKELADAGDNTSIEILALAYLTGDPFPEDQALGWELAQSAKMENPELAERVALDDASPLPEATRILALEKAADSGNGEAQYMYARHLKETLGVESKKYLAWLQEAAFSEIPQAMVDYAFHGLPEEQSITSDIGRFNWLMRAAEKGYLEAEQKIVGLYLEDDILTSRERGIEKLNAQGLELGLAQAKLHQGKILLIKGQVKEAAEMLEQGITRPDHGDYLKLLITVYLDKENGDWSPIKAQIWTHVAERMLGAPVMDISNYVALDVIDAFEARWKSLQILNRIGQPVTNGLSPDLLKTDFADLSPYFEERSGTTSPSQDAIFQAAIDLNISGIPHALSYPLFQYAAHSDNLNYAIHYAKVLYEMGDHRSALVYLKPASNPTLETLKYQLSVAHNYAINQEESQGPKQAKAWWELVADLAVLGRERHPAEFVFEKTIQILIDESKVTHTEKLDAFEASYLEHHTDPPAELLFRVAERKYSDALLRGTSQKRASGAVLPLYQQAVDKGHASALARLIECYHHQGEHNSGHLRARELTATALEADQPVGLFFSGYLDLFGYDRIGNPRDLAFAVERMREAAEAGLDLAKAYFIDLSPSFDVTRGSERYSVNKIYQSIAERDADQLAEALRARISHAGLNPPGRLVDWINLIKDIDEATGWREAISLYSNSDFPLSDPLMIIRANEALADLGDAEAQYELGLAYYEGINVLQDKDLALNYLQLAARQDHPEAVRALKSYGTVQTAQSFDQSQNTVTLLRTTQDLTSAVFPVMPYTIDEQVIVPVFESEGKARKFSNKRRRLDKFEPNIAFLADKRGQFAEGMIKIQDFRHLTPFMYGQGYGYFTGVSPRYVLEFSPDRDHRDLWLCVVNRSSNNQEQKTLWKRVGRTRAGKSESVVLRDPLFQSKVYAADVHFFDSGKEVRSTHRSQPPALFSTVDEETLPTGTRSVDAMNTDFPWFGKRTKYPLGEMTIETNQSGFATNAIFTEKLVNHGAGLQALLALQGIDFEGEKNPFSATQSAEYY
ncbi:MAG: tetratricopeptide repeat protein [Opitutales bacterium]